MVSIVFYFQVHQPRRIKKYRVFDIGKDHEYFNSDEGNLNNRAIIDKVSEKCYIPTTKLWLKLLDRHEELKLSYSISGVLLEQLEEWREDVLNLFQQLKDTGRVEFLAETYYHSLSFLYSKDEFFKQVNMHKKAIKKYFNYTPKVFRNTELIYNNSIAKAAEVMGFKAVLGEGWHTLLGDRSPNFVYKAKGSNIKVLLRNYQLSDDISFRFSTHYWEEHPLTADKFSHWVNSINGNGTNVNLFMDYETFGEHQWKETGIFDFLEHLPSYLLKHPDNDFKTPSEAVKSYRDVGEIDSDFIVSWADTERDLSAWLGNEMQQTAINSLYSLEEKVISKGEEKIKKDFRLLQTSDHFYYMCTKWFADGDVHKYFNPYDTPYDAFISFMNVLKDMEIILEGVEKKYKKSFPEAPHGKKFYTYDGRELSNVIDLLFFISYCDEEQYEKNVKNFKKWVRDVLFDKEIAGKIKKSKKETIKEVKKIIKERIKKMGD